MFSLPPSLSESLLAMPGADNKSSIERAISWAAAHDANEKASAFDLAWHLRLRGSLDPAPSAMSTLRIERLLDLQDADGGWPAGAPMLFPPPSAIDRTAGAPIYIDQERNFTTASVLAALALAAVQQKSEKPAAA